jgi:hypothetical protein
LPNTRAKRIQLAGSNESKQKEQPGQTLFTCSIVCNWKWKKNKNQVRKQWPLFFVVKKESRREIKKASSQKANKTQKEELSGGN